MEFVLGGMSACMAGIFTNPLEVVKTRVQLQGELKARGMYSVHYKNVFHAFYTIAKADGIVGLQKGLVPALWYQIFMNGIRLGTYDTLEKLGVTKTKTGDVSVPKSILAGAFAGSMGAFVGSPFFMIKTHLQAQSAPSVAVGHQHSHEGMTHAIITIYRDHGFFGLWRGVSAAMVRVTCGSSVQLATFSKCKSLTENSGIVSKDSWLAALSASMMSGVMVVACMTPMDVVSTRLYNQPVDKKGNGLIYKGLIDCIGKIFKKEGIYGFYKGWSASLLRTGPHVVLNLTFWNELKKLERRIHSPPLPIP